MTSEPRKVPATISVRARADALGSFSLMSCLTIDTAKRLRDRGGEDCDEPLVDGPFVAGAVYQVDWSALGMGGLPGGIGELPERGVHALMEVVTRLLDAIPRATRVGAPEPLRRGNVDQQRQIGNQSAGGKTIGGADLRLGEAATRHLVGVGREEKAVDQDHHAILQSRHELARNQ